MSKGDYTDVALNGVPIAGVTTGAFVDFLVQQGTPLESIHLIGFSMGVSIGVGIIFTMCGHKSRLSLL